MFVCLFLNLSESQKIPWKARRRRMSQGKISWYYAESFFTAAHTLVDTQNVHVYEEGMNEIVN